MKEYISELEDVKRKLTNEEARTLHYKRMYEQAQKDYLDSLRTSLAIENKFVTTIVITSVSILANIYFLFFR